jgi:hypothetical protein
MDPEFSILSLPRKQFLATLDELQLDPAARDDLMRQYRRENSIFSTLGLYGLLDRIAQGDEEGGSSRASIVPVSRPEGMTVAEAVMSGDARLAVPQGLLDAANALLGAADAPAAAAQGLIPAADMNEEGFNTAAAVMGLGGLLAGPRGVLDYDPSETRIFLGPRSSGADLDALGQARNLAARRRSPEEIWEQTGWFKGADGNWRYEIDDSRAVLRQPAADALNSAGSGYQTNYSGGVLHQPLLGGTYRGVDYKPAYDFMGDMDFSRENTPRGSFDRDTGRIAVAGPSSQEGLPVALHELQHAVQRQEGFAGGSNPGFEMSELLAERAAERTNLSRLIDETQSALGLSGYRPQHPDLLPLYQRYDELLERAIPEEQAYQRYLRTAGEVEANNVMNRLRMTADERRATPPWITQDFPYDEQIVRPQRGILDFSDALTQRNGQQY